MFVPEPKRRWVIESVYGDSLEKHGLLPILKKMESHPFAAGYSDVGTRNLLFCITISIRPKLVLEIGTHIGLGALIIGHALRLNDYGNLLTLEPNEDYRRTATQFLDEASLRGRVSIVPQSSTDADCIKMLREAGPFELIFIDADHSYPTALEDIELAASLLEDNGLMILHDVGPVSNEFDRTNQGGVRKALYDFTRRNSKISTIYFEYPLWMNPCGAAIVCKQRLSPAVS